MGGTMDHGDPVLDDLIGEYLLRRAFEHAKIKEWSEDLADAGELLAVLSTEMEYEAAASGRANNAAATALLSQARVRKADYRLHALRGSAAVWGARQLACGPLHRDTFVRATDSLFTVGGLDIAGLENLGGFFRRLAARMRGWDRRFAGGVRTTSRASARGRLPDVAALRIWNRCQELGVDPVTVAAHMIAKLVPYGLEKVPTLSDGSRNRRGPEESTDLVAARALVERWRKVASRGRNGPRVVGSVRT